MNLVVAWCIMTMLCCKPNTSDEPTHHDGLDVTIFNHWCPSLTAEMRLSAATALQYSCRSRASTKGWDSLRSLPVLLFSSVSLGPGLQRLCHNPPLLSRIPVKILKRTRRRKLQKRKWPLQLTFQLPSFYLFFPSFLPFLHFLFRSSSVPSVSSPASCLKTTGLPDLRA